LNLKVQYPQRTPGKCVVSPALNQRSDSIRIRTALKFPVLGAGLNEIYNLKDYKAPIEDLSTIIENLAKVVLFLLLFLLFLFIF
jgi:hypothetical protein